MKILILAALLVLLAAMAPANAVEIDLSVVIIDQTGNPAQDCDHVDTAQSKCDKYVTLTAGRLYAGAVDQSEQNLKPEEVIRRGTLAMRIRKAMNVLDPSKAKINFVPAEVDLIKEQVVKLRIPPSEIAQALELLNPPAKN